MDGNFMPQLHHPIILCRLWLQTTFPVQDNGVCMRVDFSTFFCIVGEGVSILFMSVVPNNNSNYRETPPIVNHPTRPMWLQLSHTKVTKLSKTKSYIRLSPSFHLNSLTLCGIECLSPRCWNRFLLRHLIPKESRWINSTSGKIRNMHFRFCELSL